MCLTCPEHFSLVLGHGFEVACKPLSVGGSQDHHRSRPIDGGNMGQSRTWVHQYEISKKEWFGPGVLVLFVSGTVWLQQGSILICVMMTPIKTCFWKKENGFAIMAYFIFLNSVPSVPCRCLLQTFNASWTKAFLASAQLLSSQLRSLTVMMMMKFTVWSPFCPGLNETTKRLNTRGLPGC